jgi:hypothetical protein
VTTIGIFCQQTRKSNQSIGIINDNKILVQITSHQHF